MIRKVTIWVNGSNPLQKFHLSMTQLITKDMLHKRVEVGREGMIEWVKYDSLFAL
jgi:hypothetical protein